MEETTKSTIENGLDYFSNWKEKGSLVGAPAAEVAEAVRYVAEKKGGKNIAVLSVAGRSDIADYLVLVSTNSYTHIAGIAREIEFRLSERGLEPLHEDGHGTLQRGTKLCWEVLDYGDVMVHILDHEARDFYHLEKLYAAAEVQTASATGEE